MKLFFKNIIIVEELLIDLLGIFYMEIILLYDKNIERNKLLASFIIDNSVLLYLKYKLFCYRFLGKLLSDIINYFYPISNLGIVFDILLNVNFIKEIFTKYIRKNTEEINYEIEDLLDFIDNITDYNIDLLYLFNLEDLQDNYDKNIPKIFIILQCINLYYIYQLEVMN
jgi:hypothetical protein